MSYSRPRRRAARRLPLGVVPSPFNTPTFAFAQAVDPYVWRTSPPGAAYQPYGWGPGASIGMPASYSHHIGYERVPLPPGTYDTLSGIYAKATRGGLSGLAALAPILAVL